MIRLWKRCLSGHLSRLNANEQQAVKIVDYIIKHHIMIEKILDLHIHSKYSRACSKYLELPLIAETCAIRGIDIVVTGDFTHPLWFKHINKHIEEVNPGLYQLKKELEGISEAARKTRFILGTEVSCIKKHKGKTRRVHHLIFAPSLDVAAKFNERLTKDGYNLTSDGRPILGLTSKDLLSLMLEVSEDMVMIPAHAWTPWFALFGSKSGYDSLEEAYDELTPHIFAIETGLSSDPLMNWRIPFLDNITLISNSDAHSPQKLGREANVLRFDSEESISFQEIMRVIRDAKPDEFVSTIEFYPEEGKYHYDGHRDCKVMLHPKETLKHNGLCPVCTKPVVIGVMNRIETLAVRSEEEAKAMGRIPYESIVPLPEILADTFDCGVSTKKVKTQYDAMIAALGSEFHILRRVPIQRIAEKITPQIAHAIERVRSGNIHIIPGYDGEFGMVKVFADDEDRGAATQLSLV